MIEPKQYYKLSLLIVGEGYIEIYSGNELDMIEKELHIGSETNELYYAHIANVELDNGLLIIYTKQNDVIRCAGDLHILEPAVLEIRQRLRALHREG